MQNDQRNELCDRLVTATTSLYRMMYVGTVDGRQGPIEVFPQLRTVMLLADKGPLRVSHIADYLGCTPSAMTYTVRRLVEKKLVTRVSNPKDRRVVICDLSPGGRRMLEKVDKVVRQRVLAATDTWSVERFEAVVEALESMHPGRV